jgi:hypothetical protein
MKIWGREPVLILGLVNALIALAVGFGVNVTPEQFSLIMVATTAILSFIARQQVSPTP